MSLNLEDLLKKEYVFNYFNRNKKIFTMSIILFLLFALVGSLFFSINDIVEDYENTKSINKLKLEDNIIDDETFEKVYYENYIEDENSYEDDEYLEDYDVSMDEDYMETVNNLFSDYSFEGFISLFLYNFSIDLDCVVGGLLFSIPSIIITFINAAQVGIIFSSVNNIIILLGILPHGIFEIPSSLFAFAGALMLTSFELKMLKGSLSSKTTIKEQLNNSVYLIKDAIISIVIVAILLIIAAFIETFITPILLLLLI